MQQQQKIYIFIPANFPVSVTVKQFTYFIILALSLAGPLLLSFDKRVAFRKRWSIALKATVLPAIFFIAWDIYFTAKGVWSFNPKFITGIKIFNLPVEEVAFFFMIPFCCLFIYECIRVYFHSLKDKKKDVIILKILGILLLTAGIVFHTKLYSSVTFIFCAAFIFILYSMKGFFKHFDATSFIIAWSIMLIPFLCVNYILTLLPVVKYNNAETLRLRILTIPVEDVVYGMLLIMMNVAWYEKFRPRHHRKHKHQSLHTPHVNT